MEGVAVPKTGLKNALPRDNLNTMGTARVTCSLEHTQDTLTGGNGITIARVPCAREHTPVDAFDLGALARASTVRWRSRLYESSSVRFYTHYLLECFRGSYTIRQVFLTGRREVRADIPCQE